MKVAILQSNYLPWKGYFDLIHDVDVCVLYDCVQYTTGDWRNRNQIIVQGARTWLTVPVLAAPLGTRILDVQIHEGEPWRRRHAKTLLWSYRNAGYFEEVSEWVLPWIQAGPGLPGYGNLAALNRGLIKAVCGYLGIPTRFVASEELSLEGRGTDRILDVMRKTGGDCYISGPAAKAYMEEDKLGAAGVRLLYKDYSGYPSYPQFSSVFDHHVSILDLLFQVGPKAGDFIWGWRGR